MSVSQAIVMGLFFGMAGAMFLFVTHLQQVKKRVEDMQDVQWLLREELLRLKSEATER